MPASCSDEMCRFLSELVSYAPRRRKSMREALSDPVFDEIKSGGIILPNGVTIPQPLTVGMIFRFFFDATIICIFFKKEISSLILTYDSQCEFKILVHFSSSKQK